MRCCNGLFGFFNVLFLLLSIPILWGGIWLSHRGSTDCERFLDKPLIVIGVFLMVVSAAGILGSWCRVSCLLWLYLLVMFILILLMFAFTVFAFVVTNKGAGEAVSGKGFKEFKLQDYSKWLQSRVNNDNNWSKIRSCLQDGQVCQRLIDLKASSQQFDQEDLSPFESGCCKPPIECGFIYVNATVWKQPATILSDNSDCRTWSNNNTMLCYDCTSCRAGVLQNIVKDWKKIAILNIIVLILLIVVYAVGCHVFRNNRADGYQKANP